MLVSIVPPHNDCGVRIVMHRHLVERRPFELHVASNADFADGLLIHTKIELPFPFQKIKKSRFGPALKKWLLDFENFIWPLLGCPQLEKVVDEFQPDVILTLAETGLCHIAKKVARKKGIPLAGLFLDWFPIMTGHFGQKDTQPTLSKRYRDLYASCNLAFCTSDGMQEVLGPHPNSHVIYPMPGWHQVPAKTFPPANGKFRIVYVGAAENFYGRMLRSLMHEIEKYPDMELIIVGPTQDWPAEEIRRAKKKGICLGFMPPEKAAEVLAGADALLVVMSFEREHELFMRTSFTTKFLDYSAFAKPVILWGPDYCTPSRLAKREDAALVVETESPAGVIAATKKLMDEPSEIERLSAASRRLNQTVFNPDRLQGIFVDHIEKLKSKSPEALLQPMTEN
jgi:glycosyltransferase involved in cell wall biosynthesis